MTEQMQEEVIDESNFTKYFRDVRINQIQRGEVIARYASVAEFVDGNEKKQIINLIKNTDKMNATTQVMRKLLLASEIDAIRVPKMIAEDLAAGMSEEQVSIKPYKYTLEMFFYVKPEHVPKDDPHWSIISVMNLEEYFKKVEEDKEKGLEFKAKILTEEENKKLNEELSKDKS